jgi:hypothetical protein
MKYAILVALAVFAATPLRAAEPKKNPLAFEVELDVKNPGKVTVFVRNDTDKDVTLSDETWPSFPAMVWLEATVNGKKAAIMPRESYALNGTTDTRTLKAKARTALTTLRLSDLYYVKDDGKGTRTADRCLDRAGKYKITVRSGSREDWGDVKPEPVTFEVEHGKARP